MVGSSGIVASVGFTVLLAPLPRLDVLKDLVTALAPAPPAALGRPTPSLVCCLALVARAGEGTGGGSGWWFSTLDWGLPVLLSVTLPTDRLVARLNARRDDVLCKGTGAGVGVGGAVFGAASDSAPSLQATKAMIKQVNACMVIEDGPVIVNVVYE